MDSYVTAEISVSAVRANLALLRSHLAPAVGVCAVVKADCYGHGMDALVPALDTEADMLAVATPEEAVAVRGLGARREILMLLGATAFAHGAAQREAVAELVAHDVTLTVASAEELAIVSEAARSRGHVAARVHVKVDTGMSRGGVWWESAREFIQSAREAAGVALTGLFTHFATADEADKTATREQLDRFRGVLEQIGPTDGLTIHAANSAAMIDLPETHFNMVRPGIAMYGCQPSDEMHTRLALRPAMRVVSRVMLIKDVPAGAPCGYGLTHTFERPSRIGLVPIGYADGYPRGLSNRASVRAGGFDAKVCGRVSMDQIVLDLTDAPQVAVGDEVEVVSAEASAPHSAENLARLAETIPYVITCGFGKPRVRHLTVA